MKWLIAILLVSIILISGCSQSSSIDSSKAILTKAEVESAGFSVIDWKTGGITDRAAILRMKGADDSVIAMTEKSIGYHLPISGNRSSFNIETGYNEVNGITDIISLFSSEDDAKLYYSHQVQQQAKMNMTKISEFNFGDESSASSAPFSYTTNYISAFRKGQTVVEIVIYSKVNAQDGLMKLASTIQSKLG